jgi:hypothetical protein
MALGGAPLNVAVNGGRNLNLVNGGTLAAVVGPFAPPAPDSVRLVSAVAAPPDFGLPATFGPGRGRWTAADLDRLEVYAEDLNPALGPGGTEVQVVAKTFLGPPGGFGDVQLDVHNKSAFAAMFLSLRVRYEWSGAL